MNKLSIENWIELSSEVFESNTDKIITYVSIAEGVPPHEVYDLTIDELLEKYKACQWIDAPINDSEAKDLITISDVELKLIDFNHITFGQFIDIEHFINTGFLDNYHLIIPILYLGFSKEKFKSIEYENYGTVDIIERSDVIMREVVINDVLGTTNKYIRFRANVFNTYDFFENGLEDIIYDELSDEEKLIYDEEMEKMESNKKSMWEDILSTVSNGDITKYDDILGMNLFMVLNRVSRIVQENRQANRTKTS